ncbi:hypothetical protein [Pantoea stewartii]|uniref:hypothetical protein n=1 Tax=Pantoea stewartii TaxID=66269 RepID=UPI000736EE51|nr:hypothetical protein [Pantoea stewartii]KTS27614.1 hypothetical protein NS381_09475 [Pantoea stewartii]
MRRKFAVALNSSSVEQNEKFKKFINENGLGWWHWIENFWLLTDPKGKFTASDIRDKLNEIFPKVRCIVLSIDNEENSWSGYGPTSEKKNMFNWIRDSWDKDLD